MENVLIKECLELLNHDDVKDKLKAVFNPLTDLILYQIYPYVYVIILLVFLIFILILAILILLVTLLRNKSLLASFVNKVEA
jgi:hypothetical protein